MDKPSSAYSVFYTFVPDIITILFVIAFLIMSRCFLKSSGGDDSASSFIEADAFASLDTGLRRE